MSAERAVMTTGHGGQPQSLRVIAKSCVPNCDTRESARCKVGTDPGALMRRHGPALMGLLNRVGRAVRESAPFQPKAFGREEVG